jgi:hypothetical protein
MAGYEPKWSDTQKEYFQRAWPLIRSKYDFFLSYTTRHHPPEEDNLVNIHYGYFIRVYGDSTRLGNPDANQKNQLAHTINRLLSEGKRYVGFFYETHASDNQIVESKLREACRSSFVFVQLVQNIMFHPPDKPPNYCFFEYKEADSFIRPGLHGEGRMLFIVAEDSRAALLDRVEVPEEYEGWYDHLWGKAVLYLKKFGIEEDPKIIDEFHKAFDTKVKQELGKARQRIFQGVPD